MSDLFQVWYIDGEHPMKRWVRMEIIGSTFVLYEQQWRSEAYHFGDLNCISHDAQTAVFGLDDGIKARPKWRLGIKGTPPAEIAARLPEPEKPALSGIAIIIIAFLCLAIVYMVGT